MESHDSNVKGEQHKCEHSECHHKEEHHADSCGDSHDMKEECKEECACELENELMEDDAYVNLKHSIEEVLGFSGESLSKLLDKELNESTGYDDNKHKNLINILTNKLLELGKPGTPEFLTDKTSTLIRYISVDFLLRFKDKYPFIKSEGGDVIDNNAVVIYFIYNNGFRPSCKLQKEYSKSEVTKKLNEFPTRDHLNRDLHNKMSEELYEKLQHRFNSRHPLNFFFNPNMEIKETTVYQSEFFVGFYDQEMYAKMGVGLNIGCFGTIYQGYFDKNYQAFFGREINSDGSIYEGRFSNGVREGMGETEYEDGTKEVGNWREGFRQGVFECFNKDGEKTEDKT